MINRIKSKLDLKNWIDSEKNIYNQNSFLKYCLKKIFRSESAIIWAFQKRLRYTEYYFNSNKKVRYFVSLFHLNYYRNKYGLHIPLNSCGKGLKIMHLGSILINSSSIIGENVSLHINTSIVAQGVRNDAPEIGNDIVIGVGASIVGGVKIADGIAVGANAVVTHSFEEENIAIAGNPAKKISNNGKKNWGITN